MNKLQQLHDRAALAISPVALVLAQVNIKPDKSKAPGADGLTDVVNGFAWYTLIAAAAGFLIGGACWAVGGRIGNDYTATGGKVGMAGGPPGPLPPRAAPARPYFSPKTPP